MSYRPKVKTDTAGTTVDLAIDAESIQGKVPGNSAGNIPVIQQDGKISSSILPSYVDDVVEYASLSVFPVTGETGKIYVALDTNYTYRWSGTTYIRINYEDILSSNNTFTGTNSFTRETHFTSAADTYVEGCLYASGGLYLGQDDIEDLLAAKQDTLVSGTNIKTINNQSLLGSGNIDIQGGGTSYQDITTNADGRITNINLYDSTADDTQNITSTYIDGDVYIQIAYLNITDYFKANDTYITTIYANSDNSDDLSIRAYNGEIDITSGSTFCLYGYWDGRSNNNCASQICLTDNDYGGIVFYDRGGSYQSGGQTLYSWRTLAEFDWDDTDIYAEDITLTADSCLYLHSKDDFIEILFYDQGNWYNTNLTNKVGGKVNFEYCNLNTTSAKNGSRISFKDCNGYNTSKRLYSSDRTYMTVDSRIGYDSSTGREIGGITWYGDMYVRSVSQNTMSQGGSPDSSDGEMHLIADNYLIMKGSEVRLTADDDQLTISAYNSIYLRPYYNDNGGNKIELYLSDDEYGCMAFYDASDGSGSTYSKHQLFYVSSNQFLYQPGIRSDKHYSKLDIEYDVDLHASENLILEGYSANVDAKCQLCIGNFGEVADTPGMVFYAWLGTSSSTELFKVTNNDITYKGVSLLGGGSLYLHTAYLFYDDASIDMNIYIISNKSTALTASELGEILAFGKSSIGVLVNIYAWDDEGTAASRRVYYQPAIAFHANGPFYAYIQTFEYWHSGNSPTWHDYLLASGSTLNDVYQSIYNQLNFNYYTINSL